MSFYTFHDIDESSDTVSGFQSTIRSVCDVSAVEAARNRALTPQDAIVAYVDLGDGTVQYYYNEEAKLILDHTGKTIASAVPAGAMPSDAVTLINARHFRQEL